MMKQKIGIATEDDINKEFIDAWHRAEKDEITEPEERIYFSESAVLFKILSNHRVKLLHILRQHGTSDIRSLSSFIGRNYQAVYKDVQVLKKAGLIHQTIAKDIFVPWDKIQTEINL